MATNSKPAYDRNSQRASHFLTIHANAQQGAGAPRLPLRELPRAAIVFSVGAIDAYLSEVTAEVMVRQLQTAVASADARSMLKQLQSEIPTLSIEVAVLPTNADRITRIREALVDLFHNRVSNHGAKAVGATMARIGKSSNDVWSYMTSNGFANPADYLDEWTDKRHQIVHRGTRPAVRRPQATKFIEFADALVARIDAIAETA